MRSIPKNLSLNLDLASIKILKIFKWLKTKRISDQEMIRTFNCGVGFCIITSKRNSEKIQNYFIKILDLIKLDLFSKEKKKINLINHLKW